MLIISNNLGFLPKPFFPKTAGRDYEMTQTLEPLKDVRGEFSIFSGMSHPDVNGGHSAENCFLTAARGPTKSGFRNQISLDQFAVEKLGQLTRFPTLLVSHGAVLRGAAAFIVGVPRGRSNVRGPRACRPKGIIGPLCDVAARSSPPTKAGPTIVS